ncbi:MAG: DUF6049 family protein [Nocardioidaceae bacterium]
MIPPRRARTVACLLAGLLAGAAVAGIGGSVGASPAQAAQDDPAGDPLAVTIDGIDPAVIPAKGPLRVTGTITNDSDADWSDLQAYLVISPNPLRTRAALDDAAGSAPDTYFGDRLAGEGQYDDTITDLKPGKSTRFGLTVRRKDLDERISGRSGVYQLGIQVLGAEDGVRTDGADGRARTFITLMPKKNPPTTALGVLVQVRAPVSYDSTGQPLSADRWNQLLSADGRLGRLLSLTTAGPAGGPGIGTGGGPGVSPGFPFSYLVDPAVPDLAKALAEGSPGYDLSLGRTESEPSESPSPSESPEASPGTNPETNPGTDSGLGAGDTTGDTTGDPLAGMADAAGRAALPEADSDDTTTTAAAWLKLLETDASAHGVLAVPYGDVDVEAAYQARFGPLVEHATRHGIERLTALGIAASPVIAPPDGSLTQSTSQATAALGPQLLGASQVDVRDTRVDTTAGAHVTVADDVFSATDTTIDRTALGVRQRTIAEAAVHALGSRADQPLVVTLPSRWDPGAQWERSHFFEALTQVPWLTGTPVSDAVRSPLADSVAEPAVLPQNPPDKSALVPAGNFTEAATLQRVAGTLDATLDRSGKLAGQFDSYAYLATSAQYRKAPLRSQLGTAAITASLRGELDKVSVRGPSFVTMSSDEGRFQATVTNDLDEAVVVGVHAVTSSDKLTIDDAEPVRVEPGQRRTVTMRATSSGIGVWPVTLKIVNADGEAIGEPESMRLRSSHVSQFIWAIIGVGTLVLVIAIVIRTRGKVRDRFGHHPGPEQAATDGEPGAGAPQADPPTDETAGDAPGRVTADD